MIFFTVYAIKAKKKKKGKPKRVVEDKSLVYYSKFTKENLNSFTQ